MSLYLGAILEAGVNVTAQALPPFFFYCFFCLLFCILCSLCVCCFAFIVRLLFRVYCASVAVLWPLRVFRFLLGFYGLSRCFPPLVSCLSFLYFPFFAT